MRFQLIATLFLSSLVTASSLEGRGEKSCDRLDLCVVALRIYPAASSFCSSFLGVPKVTVTAKTVTPLQTITATSTVITTATAGAATTVTTTFTTTFTTSVTSMPTITARDISCEEPTFGLPCGGVEKRNNGPVVPAGLKQFAEAKISSACSCLAIAKATTTITATAAAKITTITVITTKITTTTSIATSTTATTTTTTVTATVTPTPKGICDISYNASGNGVGNTINFVSATSASDCCQKCQNTPNCVANAYTGSQCQLLVNTVSVGGGSGVCPLGVEKYAFGPETSGIVYAGPCGING